MGRKRHLGKVLVIGACGSVGRELVHSLLDDGIEVIGVDRRPWPGRKPEALSLYNVELSKRPFEDVFRQYRPLTVMHAGLVSTPTLPMEARYEHNVIGLQRLFNFCGQYGAERLVVLSRGSVYGANLHNPARLSEDAPLRGAIRHSGMRDIVEADILAQSLAIRETAFSTAIVRPANVVGSEVRNTMVGYLRLSPVPTLLGYDPMFQVIHVEDLVVALRMALASDAPGVFNVAGPGEAPLSVIISESGGRRLPILFPFFSSIVGAMWARGLSNAPLPHEDYLRYPCLLDCGRAQYVLGFRPSYSMHRTLAALRRSRIEPGIAQYLGLFTP